MEAQDWRTSPDFVGLDEYPHCFSKGLSHRPDGFPVRQQCEAFWSAVRERSSAKLEKLSPVVPWPRKVGKGWHPAAQGRLQLTVPWVDPCSGNRIADLDFDESPDSRWFGSVDMLGDVAELYWASLCRDIPFVNYASNSDVAAARAELEHIDKGQFSNGPFYSSMPLTTKGNYISQFLLKSIPLNGSFIAQRIQCPVPQADFMGTFDDWIAAQNGKRSSVTTTHLVGGRYIHNGRALAEYVRTDFSFQAFLCAGLILQSWGRQVLNPSLPARTYFSSSAFVRTGWPEIYALLAEASQVALEDCWYWKWRVFRRMRPEELAGRIVYSSVVERYGDVPQRIVALNAVERCRRAFGTQALTQAYPEGAPLHPAFPGGHAEIAGACVTILKVFTDLSFPIPAPVHASEDGLVLQNSSEELTLEGELNKLAWNLSFGRTYAGIHYRSDNIHGLALGESIALKMLAEKAASPGNRVNVRLRKFDGSQIEVPVRC